MMKDLNRNLHCQTFQRQLSKNKNVHCKNLKTETVHHNYNSLCNSNYKHKLMFTNSNNIKLLILLIVCHNCKSLFHKLKSNNLSHLRMLTINNNKINNWNNNRLDSLLLKELEIKIKKIMRSQSKESSLFLIIFKQKWI